MKVQHWGCLYRLTNKITLMVYIGKTINFKNRMRCHKYAKDNYYIHSAIRKYGWDNFKVEKIIVNVPEEDLNNLERAYIAVENTKAPNGYNLTDGGEGASGYVHTEEWKKKRRQMHVARHRAYSTIGNCRLKYEPSFIEGQIGLYAIQHITEVYNDALPLYEEPPVKNSSDLILIAQQAK
jgi:group I intron endonuclease